MIKHRTATLVKDVINLQETKWYLKDQSWQPPTKLTYILCFFVCFDVFLYFLSSPQFPPSTKWLIYSTESSPPPQDLLKHSYSEDKTENIYQVLN